MINKIPFIGWFFSFIASVSLSVPFWIAWTVCHIGEKYAYFLPKVYQAIPFWDCVGLFICISIIKGMLIPKLASFSSSNSNTNKK